MKAAIATPRNGQKALFTCSVELTDLFNDIDWQ